MKLFIPCFRPLGPEPTEREVRRAEIPVMVAERFSWRVLLFGWLGLLSFGTWISALLAAAFAITVLHVLHGVGLKIGFAVSLHLVLATFTSDIRLWELRINGWSKGEPIAAPNRDIALLRWVDHQAIYQRDTGACDQNAAHATLPPELPCASS